METLLRAENGFSAKCKLCKNILKTKDRSTHGLHVHLNTVHKIVTKTKNVVSRESKELMPPARKKRQKEVKQPSSNMIEACRTCLRLIDIDKSAFYELEADDIHLSAESCRYKLLSIVPEMALDITPKSILCAECHGSLESLFEFKEKCLKTENIITRYLRAQPGIKNIDLKYVSDFNTNNVRLIKDEDVETLFEDKVELSGSIITNVMHEIEDFSSVEVARPKNAVPASSDDINVIKDKTFKEEVELSETVVTNVKGEDDSPESVTVAKNTVPDLNFACEYCDKRFKYTSLLKSHLRTHTKPYRCKICDCHYREKSHLKIHMKIHTDKKRFRCETCNDHFVRKDQLSKHQQIHKGLRPYVCVICNKGYCSERELGVHGRIHCDTRPRKCAVCSKGFNIKGLLIEHLRTHTAERPYQCETCEKTFTLRCSMIRHLRQVHSGIKNVECKYCKKRFFRKGHVKRHIMNVHKDVALKLR